MKQTINIIQDNTKVIEVSPSVIQVKGYWTHINEPTFGYLYNSYDVENIINPIDGFKLINYTEALSLKTYLDPNGGEKIKTTDGWSGTIGGGTDDYGVSFLPAGRRWNFNGGFLQRGELSNLWIGFESNNRWGIFLSGNNNAININWRRNNDLRDGYAIRAWCDYDSAIHGVLGDGDEGIDYVGNDAKVYKTVKIGDFLVTKTNLAETKYNDGTDIPVSENNTQWVNLTTGARCAYDNIEDSAFDRYLVAKLPYKHKVTDEDVLNALGYTPASTTSVSDAQKSILEPVVFDLTSEAGTTHTVTILPEHSGKTLYITSNLDDIVTVVVGNDIVEYQPITIRKAGEFSLELRGSNTDIIIEANGVLDDAGIDYVDITGDLINTVQIMKAGDDFIWVI